MIFSSFGDSGFSMFFRMLHFSLCFLLAVALMASAGIAQKHQAMALGAPGLQGQGHNIAAMTHANPPLAMAHHASHASEDAHPDCCLFVSGGCAAWCDIAALSAFPQPVLSTVLKGILPELKHTGITPEQLLRPPRI